MQGIAVSVYDLDSAIATYWTSDNMDLFARALFGADNFELSSSRDLARGYDGNDRMMGAGGADALYGGNGRDLVHGDGGKDALYGEGGNDELFGDESADDLFGGTGRDKLTGGAGADDMYGGQNDRDRDVFIFTDPSDSRTGDRADTLYDFVEGLDRINLQSIDARASSESDQAFRWSGQTAAKHAVWWTLDKHGISLRGDVDGDKTADFAIHVDAVTNVSMNDLLL